MKQQIVYNLEEFAAKYHLTDIFGAYAAHFSINREESGKTSVELDGKDGFKRMVEERTLFTKLLIVTSGYIKIAVGDSLEEIKSSIGNSEDKTTKSLGNSLDEKDLALDDCSVRKNKNLSQSNCSDVTKEANTAVTRNTDEGKQKYLRKQDFLIVSAKEVACILETSPDFEAECILVDEYLATETTLFHLSDDKNKSILDIFHFVRDIVRHQHINKVEMIRSMFNVLKLIIEELPYEQCSVTRDLGHKKEVYEIFLHHLYRSFRKERQIRFYADKLNVSTAYLSRLVKEISGSTVNDHVTSLIYKEICNLLKQSDMTMGEIADYLSFSDQSALTNFFKQRSGMTPLAYRNK